MTVTRILPTALAAIALTTPALAQTPFADGLTLVSELRLPADTAVDGVPFGGISGLDPVGADGRYVALSDDRAEKGPARFYTLSLGLDAAGALSLDIEGSTEVRAPDGGSYGEKTVDPEAVRYDAATDSLFWVSEIDAEDQAMLRQMAMDGTDLRAFDLPAGLRTTAEGMGHVKSASLESLALTPDGATLFTVTENALQQDGPRATATTVSPLRLMEIDKETGAVRAEYLYVTDPVAHVSADPEKPWSDNGVADLLSLGDGRFISVERNGWHVGGFEFHFAIKAYLVDITGASDIADIPALAGADVASLQPVQKTLLVDFATLGLDSVDNIEAVAPGPVIDGAPSLIFASDNNFDGRQVTQFILMK